MKTMSFAEMEMVKGGNAVIDCINDAYTNHGWVSVWALVQTAFIPETIAAIAGVCAYKNL